jgi:hypothetical protein
MPAGMVRPRASQVPPLGLSAQAEAIRRGWRIVHGVMAPPGSITEGPCGLCRRSCERYGENGRSLCPACMEVVRPGG